MPNGCAISNAAAVINLDVVYSVPSFFGYVQVCVFGFAFFEEERTKAKYHTAPVSAHNVLYCIVSPFPHPQIK